MIEALHIGFQKLSKSYGKKPVLDQISFEIASHECLLLTGENGAGKTTLLRIIAGLEKPDQCDVAFENASIESWRKLRKQLLKSIMYLHQQPYMLSGTVRRNLEYTAALNPALIDRETSVNRALQWGELEALESQQANSLSGGQKQRVALARARLRNPRLLLLDEPTANLDSESRERTMKMLAEFRDSGTALIIVSHDPGNFENLATRRLLLKNHHLTDPDQSATDLVKLDNIRQLKQ
ncbi:MAG: ABC transporter ATP-binding protein [Pseudomonadota bacterium]